MHEFKLRKHWQKTTDLEQTMILRRTPQILKKVKNRHKQIFEDEANDMQLDKGDNQ